MSAATKVRVLIVDDSATVRQALADVLGSDPEIEVIATASDPLVAAERLREAVPDVITLDLEMPRMHGLEFLEQLMRQHPLPVVVCSTLTTADSDYALQALDKGAIDVISKPTTGAGQFFRDAAAQICETVKAAARSRCQRHGGRKVPAPVQRRPMVSTAPDHWHRSLVVIGASTGGPEAITAVLTQLPANIPGIVIVQHMPEHFTAAFAKRLATLCAFEVREARDGDVVRAGCALIAPGNHHTLIAGSAGSYRVQVREGPLVSRHRPSVDVLFRSAARYAGADAVGVILTGMGDDGARGMRELHDAGALTIAQDEASCVVYGMPKAALAHGGVDVVAPLDRIADAMLRALAKR